MLSRAPEQVIAIDDEELVRTNLLTTLAQRITGALRIALRHARPLFEIRLRAQIFVHLFGQIVRHHDDAIDFLRQRSERPVEDRPTLHFQERLRRLLRMGP